MEGEWNHLQTEIKASTNQLTGINEPFWQRLLSLRMSDNVGPSDIAIRYRDALLCAAANGITTPFLHLDPLHFDAGAFKNAGLIYSSINHKVSLATAELDEAFTAVYQRKRRRFLVKEKVDLSLKNKLRDENYCYYNGKGQALAVRHTLLSPNNSTILINLPTGSGKTFVVHSQALFTPSHKLTLVIVPTVSLAIEQGSKAQQMLKNAGQDHGGPYSLYGGMVEAEKQKVISKVTSGKQRILFTSPEMMATKLRASLFNLAKSDGLASIVVDEAHLICQWGSEFRPDFQKISPLVHVFRKHSSKGIKVLLLSATFSPYTIDALEATFKESAPIKLVNGAFLRPEPTYLVQTHKSPHAHDSAVKNAVWRLPRPMILYTSTQRDAQYWHKELRRHGFYKTGLFHGATEHDERVSLLCDWQNGDIDVMVATSAFGVGMDKSDVRSVLHTSVPENIDRYYQESGRGGRDGSASLSLIICHSEQFSLARRLNQEKLISPQIGFDRWQHMLRGSEKPPGENIRIDLKSRRYSVKRESERNENWNLLTLLLMQRANLIKLKSLPMATNAPPQDCNSLIDVEIIHDGHLTEKVWNSEVENQRRNERQVRSESYSILKKWVEEAGGGYISQPLCNILKSFYTYRGYQPEGACGGCPECLKTKRAPRTPTLGNNSKVVALSDNTELSFGHITEVYYQSKNRNSVLLRDWKGWISILIKERRIQAIRAKLSVLSGLAKILSSTEEFFWCSIEHNAPASGFDELVLVMPDESEIPSSRDSASNQILIAPMHIKDPNNTFRDWWQSNADTKSLDSFCREISYVNHQ